MPGLFPTTNLTAIGRARSHDRAERERAWLELAAVYHRPVYLHLRLKWRKSAVEAEDLTQHFFLHAIENELLGAYDPARGRFRTFVRVCADRVVMNDNAARRALKRSGGARHLDIDFTELEAAVADNAAVDPDRVFEEEWARSVLAASVSRLEKELAAEGRSHQFEVFSRYDLAETKATYAEIAEALGISVHDVTNYLAAARRRFRAVALEMLRELTASEEEFQAEAAALFGVDPR